MKVALIHDWLNGMRGGEKILEVLCELYPEADIFTLLLEEEKISPRIREMRIRTSFIQRLPFAFKRYRSYLALFPLAVESFNLSGYDLVISTSHAVAKGARTTDKALNICYCFTPMRYLWFFHADYFGSNPLKNAFLWPLFAYLRRWDRLSSRRVDRFCAISKNVARRIAQIYGRESEVIYPPVDTEFFVPDKEKGDYFLMVSALVPYKRIDLAIAAFNRLRFPLTIIGTGPEEERLRLQAGSTVEFLGWQSNERLREYYQRCRALIFPGIEDFGIVPLEAMACGRPVIGLGEGGLLESVIAWREGKTDSATGIFFYEQTEKSLIGAVELFLQKEKEFDKETIRQHSLKFDRKIFKLKIKAYIEESIAEFNASKEKFIL